MLRLLLIVIPLAITVYAFFDAVLSPRAEVRTLPKWLWILLIILLWIGGAVLWFVLGRPRSGAPGNRSPRTARTMGPDDDPDFLSSIDPPKP